MRIATIIVAALVALGGCVPKAPAPAGGGQTGAILDWLDPCVSTANLQQRQEAMDQAQSRASLMSNMTKLAMIGVLGLGLSVGLVVLGQTKFGIAAMATCGIWAGLAATVRSRPEAIEYGGMALLTALFAGLIWLGIKHRTALAEVVTHVQMAKAIRPEVRQAMVTAQTGQRIQSVRTERTVRELKEKVKKKKKGSGKATLSGGRPSE